MCKIGFIDDEKDMFVDYQKRLSRRNIDLIFAENCDDENDIINWLLSKEIQCVLVDHKLTAQYAFLGTDLVAFINEALPHLPCIILTNYPEDSEGENVVVKNLILDRNKLDATDLSEFVSILRQSVEVFKNRKARDIDKYKQLLTKKQNGGLSAVDEEQFLLLYKQLRAYGEVDDIPVALLKSDIDKKLDDLLSKLDTVIEK